MKILSLSLDNSSLNKKSALAGRLVEYGGLVEKYDVVAPNSKADSIELSKKVRVYGSGGKNKLCQLIAIYNLAKKILRRRGYDIITVQDQYYLGLIGLCLSKKFKVGLEIQVHGFEKYYGLRKLTAKYVLPRVQAVRCVSQRLKKQLVGKLGVAEGKITVAPIYSSQENKLSAVECKKGTGKFIFLTVGRLVAVKNIGLQVAAMAEVTKKFSEAELWIVGDGPESNNLKFKILNLKLATNVKLLGWRDNLGEYYSLADAFVLTSNSEGWGLAAVEAASFGLPIIMTDVGLAGEVIKNGESGLVIPVGDKQKLVEAMFKIINDESLRNKIGANAKLAVNRLPTKEQTLALYKKSWELAIKNSQL